MTEIQYIKEKINLSERSISNTLELLAEGATIPFIARYRKDKTQNLDELAIESIQKYAHHYAEIQKRKESILNSIQEQEKLTPELKKKIENTYSLQELEDLYLPYKKRRKTKADTAREKGLEPLAKIIMAQNANNLDFIAQKYLSEQVSTPEEALQGAQDIIAEWINENVFARKRLRQLYSRKAQTTTKKTKKVEENPEQAQKYEQYFDWNEPIRSIPSHRLLAILRAENEGFLKLKIEADNEENIHFLEQNFIKNHNETAQIIAQAAKDAYKRLLEPSISNEILQEAKEKADHQAIQVFAENLKQLLLAPPLGQKRILAIDPGFKTGCKVVCLNEQGDLLHNETIFPHPPQKETALASKKIKSMVEAYKIEAIAIGNGTASRETEDFIQKIPFNQQDLQVFVVSEAGASVYSASKIAREEFPNYDVTVRGAVSIGRRLSDPLAELEDRTSKHRRRAVPTRCRQRQIKARTRQNRNVLRKFGGSKSQYRQHFLT